MNGPKLSFKVSLRPVGFDISSDLFWYGRVVHLASTSSLTIRKQYAKLEYNQVCNTALSFRHLCHITALCPISHCFTDIFMVILIAFLDYILSLYTTQREPPNGGIFAIYRRALNSSC